MRDLELEVLKTLRALEATAESVIEELDSKNLTINMHIIYRVVESVVEDVRRVEQFNVDIIYADNYKISAFLMKWIIQLKPIQFIIDKYNENEVGKSKRNLSFMCNECFAIRASLNSIYVRPDGISDDYFILFSRILNFRPTKDDAWLSFLLLTIDLAVIDSKDAPIKSWEMENQEE